MENGLFSTHYIEEVSRKTRENNKEITEILKENLKNSDFDSIAQQILNVIA